MFRRMSKWDRLEFSVMLGISIVAFIIRLIEAIKNR